MRRIFVSTLGFGLIILFFRPTLYANGAASGTIAKGGPSLAIVDAYAYERKSSVSKEGVIAVHLSSTPLNHEAIKAAIDTQHLLENAEGFPHYAELEFEKDGTWRGGKYHLPGGSYGHSGDSIKTNVNVAKGVLRGSMKVASKDYRGGDGPAIDLKLDVPIVMPTGMTDLPKDGGEPGKKLVTCNHAFQTRDKEALKSCSDKLSRELDAYENEGNLVSFWTDTYYGCEALNLKSIRIKSGRTKGNQAEIFVEGSKADVKCEGSTYLVRDGETWKLHHDRMEEVLEETP